VKRSNKHAEEFEMVAMPHTESLWRAALRLTQDTAAAEDLVQEALLHGWRAFHQFERGTNCKAWLFRIMLNLSSKRRQKLEARPALLSLDEYESSYLAPQMSQTVPAQFTAGDVFGALDALPEDHRTVLVLAVVEGFTCKEVARMLDVPIGTIMSRLSRARVSLRQQLTKEN